MKQPETYALSSAISQSDLKMLRKDITQFFSQVEMGDRQPKRATRSLEVGDIVDCLLTNPNGMEDYVTNGVGCSEALKEIVDTALFNINNIKDADSKQQCLTIKEKSLVYLVKAAREKNWNKQWSDEAIGNNVWKQAGRYFELRALHPDKVIVPPDLYQQAKKAAEKIEADTITGPIIRGEGGFRIEKQLELYGHYSSTDQKGLLDLGLFDDKNRIVYPYDIKTVVCMAQFLSNYYKYGYGYQGSWYDDLLKQSYPDYVVKEFRFIVTSTTTDEAPMVFRMPKTEIALYAEGGYDRLNRKVIGWKETVMDLEWHRRTGNWSYPRSYYQNKELVIDSLNLTIEDEDPF